MTSPAGGSAAAVPLAHVSCITISQTRPAWAAGLRRTVTDKTEEIHQTRHVGIGPHAWANFRLAFRNDLKHAIIER